MSSCFAWCRTAEESAVRELDFSNLSLEDVPTSIFLYERTLDTLNLSSNKIEDLPTPLFSCQNLQVLNLSDNVISLIPPAIGQLSSLRSLDVSRNYVDKVPATITRCKQLSKVNLSLNPLKQLPESVTQLVALEELYLCSTGLYFLPANMGRLTGLRILELRDNRLSSLPPALHRCSLITRLDLGQNDFTYLPNRVGDLQELEELWLDLNGMVQLPEFIGNLKQLSHLDASENRLEDLPKEIGDCKQLTELALSSNDITRLPKRIGELSNLITLKLDDNQLKKLPSSIGGLHSLEELNVSNNQLQELPPNIGLLRNLKSLAIDNNQLASLPPEIGSCTKLTVITAQKNLLRSIPAEIGQLQCLGVLSLSNNLLTNLPISVLNLRELRALWLVDNQSKPLTPLVKERDSNTGAAVLTCYLFPQTQNNASNEEAMDENRSDPKGERNKQKSYRPKIRFSLHPVSEKEPSGSLLRVPTPYPKRLKEMAKSARALSAQGPPPQPTSSQDTSVVNSVREMNALTDQVRTAVVKKQPPSSTVTSGSDERLGARQQPPPYHIAAASSRQYSLFHQTPRRDERSDIDSEALNSLKDSLLHVLPKVTMQDTQSEQSSSAELMQYQRSEADSAFIEPSTTKIIPQPTLAVPTTNGTYSALPGIVTEEIDYDDSTDHPITKVNDWLKTKMRGLNTLHEDDEFSCGLINMYPLENSDQNSTIPGTSSSSDEKPDDYILSSKIRHTRKSWLFGNHKNPQVVEITLQRAGSSIGFEVRGSDLLGVYVKKVYSPSQCPGLCVGDKILQIDGLDVEKCSPEYISRHVRKFTGPVSMMISRQN